MLLLAPIYKAHAYSRVNTDRDSINTMIKITFSVNAWIAQSPTIQTPEEWQAWSEGRSPVAHENSPSPKSIPAMLRRRLSPLGKLALSCFEQLPENQASSAVFCSEHGEVERTVSLLSGIARGDDMSPSNFSVSVHNAIAGIYSIAHKYHGAINAICAGPNSLFTTLIEAYGLIQSGHEQVACLIYDEPLPGIYQRSHCLGREALAIAILLSKAEPGTEAFGLLGEPHAEKEEPAGFPGEQLIEFLLSPETPLSYRSNSHLWTLHRTN